MDSEHGRWFHPMYMYPDNGAMLPNNGGLSQSYTSAESGGGEHYYNHNTNGVGLAAGNSDLTTSRSGLSGHSPYLCHPHSPPLNSSEGVGNCPSRLYLPNSCRSQGLHSSNPSYNQSSMWPHMTSVAGSLSLPQFPPGHNSHGKEPGIPPVDISPNYNQDDGKFKLNQALQNYPGFSPHLYPPHMSDYQSSVNGVPFDMLPGLPRCRTISRSNSGKYIIYWYLFLK